MADPISSNEPDRKDVHNPVPEVDETPTVPQPEDIVDGEPAQDLQSDGTAGGADAITDADFVPAPADPPRGGGKGLMLLAGFLTAAFGFGAGWLSQKPVLDNLRGQITAQEATLDEFGQRLDGFPAEQIEPLRAEISALADAGEARDDQLEQLAADLQAAQEARGELKSELEAQIEQARARLSERLDSVEMIASGGQADANSAGEYVRRVEERLSTLERNAEALTEARDELRAEADAAEAAARMARARAGLAEVNTALGNGRAFSEAIPAIEVIAPVPASLKAAAEDGVPTIEALRADYVTLARAALQIARESGGSGEIDTGLGSLFRKQLKIRSTVPREGATVDAILSRVEASLWNDELSAALTELKTLPPEPRSVFDEWINAAQLREQSLDAVADLAQMLDQK